MQHRKHYISVVKNLEKPERIISNTNSQGGTGMLLFPLIVKTVSDRCAHINIQERQNNCLGSEVVPDTSLSRVLGGVPLTRLGICHTNAYLAITS